MKFLKVLILGVVIISPIAIKGYSIDINWDKVIELHNYNLDNEEHINLFTLCSLEVNPGDSPYSAQYELNKWFPSELDGNLFIVLDNPVRGNFIYRLSHDYTGNIIMEGLDGQNYRFTELFSEMATGGKIDVYYAPDYLIPESLESQGFQGQGYMVPPALLGDTATVNFGAENFNAPVIPPDHPLAKWDINYYKMFCSDCPHRNTNFGWELPILVDIGRLYGLSDDEIKLLIAIRVWENGSEGNEFGVKKARGTNLVEQTHWAAGSIRNAGGNLLVLAPKWAPTVGVPASEAAENASWLPGVSSIWAYLKNYTLEDLLSYLNN